jgi:asparagine synthase (glutamine-hydrolysing)
MCGIAGFVSFAGHDPAAARARVQRMGDILFHRGPDEEGFFVDDRAALAHRRLAIIDVKSGHQPMADVDGLVQIVFNGEIYNFLEVRRELELSGHRFRTNSDTEVILMAYIQWGERCVERLNGMFAFAIWDARKGTLLLARDRVGKKPLYYVRTGTALVFASELKALRASGLCPTTIDPESLDCYFTFGYVPAPRTIYKEVRKLRPAHWLMASNDGHKEVQYWKLSYASTPTRSLQEATEECEALLDDAVRRRMVSEVPLGAFLSGGLDSSLVVSSMTKNAHRPVLTNSIGFQDRNFNELPLAAAIARHLQTDHHEFVVEPKASDVLEKIAWHFDEPMADSSAVPTWYVCEMARRTVTVALSGDGGDETFGGYTFRYVPHMVESKVRSAIPVALRTLIFGTLGAGWPGSAWLPRPLRLKTIFENLAVGDAEAFYRDLAWLRSEAREALYSADFRKTLKGFTPFETVHPYYAHNDAPDALGRSQFADIHFYMTDDVLVKVDRMSMAHSLEVRSPLLDYRLIEFAASLPPELKIKGRRGKVVLNELASRRLPEKILNQPKRGFSIPAARWLRGPLRPMAESLLFHTTAQVKDYLNPAQVTRMWQEHLSGSRDHHVFLWGLMMLHLWEQGAARVPETVSP